MINRRNEIVQSKANTKSDRGNYPVIRPRIEMLNAMTELSKNAYFLLDYYYTVKSGWIFDDNQIKVTIGTDIRGLQRAKKELKDKGYLYIAKGNEVNNYYIGKQAVDSFKKSTTSIII